MKLLKYFGLLGCVLYIPDTVNGLNFTIGGLNRTGSLNSATTGVTGTGNATAADVDLAGNGIGALGPWTERGEETSSGNTGIFDVALTSGSWGSGDAAGTWGITDANFWSTYANAAISMHVGNGGGDPDHWIWLIENGQTSGTWAYSIQSGTGGGLSNLKLYSSGTGSTTTTTTTTTIPDVGTSVLLLGLSLLGIGAFRRSLRK